MAGGTSVFGKFNEERVSIHCHYGIQNHVVVICTGLRSIDCHNNDILPVTVSPIIISTPPKKGNGFILLGLLHETFTTKSNLNGSESRIQTTVVLDNGCPDNKPHDFSLSAAAAHVESSVCSH